MNKVKMTIATFLIMLSTTVAYAGGITVDVGPTLDIGTGTMNVTGDVTVDGTLILGTGTLTLTGNWAKTGTFTSGTGIVVLKGTTQSDITGTNSFYNLTIDTLADGAKTIRFGATETQTISNNLILTGYSGKILTIRSTSDGTAGIIDIPASIVDNVDFVNVKDNAINGVNTITAGSSSTGVSNTPNWIFKVTDSSTIPAGKYVCVTPHEGAVKDLAGNAVNNIAVCTAVAVPTAPTGVSFSAVGGTVLADTLNSTNTNFTASATIVAGEATGGSAELLKNGISFAIPITDTSIGGGDTAVTFDALLTTNGQVQAAFASGATLSVRLTDSFGNTIESSVANPAILVDYVAPTAPSGATIVAESGWSTDYISSSNATAVKVSGTKSTDTTSVQIDIDDEDTFTSAKTTTLSGLGAITTYADAVGIDVTTAMALNDGNIAIRITATDVAGNTAVQTVFTASGIFKKDVVAPTFGVSFDQSDVNSGNETAISFTFSGAETPNISYDYSIDDTSGGTVPITGSGTIITATDTISNINVSSLIDSLLTLSASLTDLAGNQTMENAVITKSTANHFTITSSDNTPTAGTAFNVTITAKDSSDVTVTNYSPIGNTFIFSGPGNAPDTTAPLYPSNAAIIAAFSNGVATVPVTLYNAEVVSLDVSDGTYDSTGDISYDADLTVGPGTVTNNSIISFVPDNVTADGGSTTTITVTARDAYNNPVPGIPGANINVTASGTGNTLSAFSATNGSGQATATLSSTTAEVKTLTLVDISSVADGDTTDVTFVAGIATNIALLSGNGQSGVVATTLGSQLIAKVTDINGNAVSGASVTFAIVSTPNGATGQILSVTNALTDASGQASSALTLGDLVGSYTVGASSSGLTGSPVTFTATGNADNAANLELISGDGQAAAVNTALSGGFVVKVTDQFGNAVSGESVTFAINSTPSGATGQSLSVTSTSTNASGQATSILTLGNLIGNYTITAVSGTLIGSPVVFTAAATASAPNAIALVSGNLQSGVVGTTLTNAFVVSVTDASGNPSSGQSVTFAITGTPTGAAGQSLSVTSTSTNASGQATSTLTLGNLIGTYTVTATAPGLSGSPVIFTTTGIADNAANIGLVGGDSQNALINSELSSSFVVVVTDQHGNPVNSEVVVFAITGTPTGATGQSLSQTTIATNTIGQSSSVLTLGNLIGVYTVTATSGSLTGSPVTFNATATLGGISAETSTVAASPTSVAADGIAISTITVTLRDAGGNSISGLAVSLTSNRGAVDNIIINGVTDGAGQITGTVRSITSGIATIVAVGDPAGQNVTITQTANITFTAINQDFAVQIDPFYDAANDAIVITTLLLKNGVLNTDIANMTLEIIGVSDDTGISLSGNLNGPGDTATDVLNAIFHTVWDPASGLTADTVYTIIAKIKYSNITYSGIKAFSVDQLGGIKDTIDNLNTKADTVEDTATDARTKVGDIESNVDALDVEVAGYEVTQAAYRTATLKTLSSLTSNVGAILEDAQTTIPNLLADEISSQLAKGIQLEILTRPGTVVTGATVPLRFRSASRLSPKMTVYDPNDVAKINNAAMVEVGKTGIYEYKITFNTDWGTGSFMVLVQEPTKKSVDSLVLNVEDKSTDVVTSTDGGSSAVTLDTLYSRITGLDSDMDSLITNIDTVKDNTTGVDGDIDDLIKKIDSGTITDAMTQEDIQKLVGRLNSVSEDVGVVGDDADYSTVLGKLKIIEETLGKIGADGDIGLAFNYNAKQKAGNITEFIHLITTELKEKGTVENLEGKMEILEGYLIELKGAVSEISVSVTAGNLAESVEATLRELNTLATGNEGLGELMRLVGTDVGAGVTDGQFGGGMSAEEILEMRNDVSALKSLMVEIRGLLDSEVNKPVIHGWLEGN